MLSVARETMPLEPELLSGVEAAEPAPACKHIAGCALAICTPGVNAGVSAARKRRPPICFKME